MALILGLPPPPQDEGEARDPLLPGSREDTGLGGKPRLLRGLFKAPPQKGRPFNDSQRSFPAGSSGPLGNLEQAGELDLQHLESGLCPFDALCMVLDW